MKKIIISTLIVMSNIVSAQSFLFGMGGGVSEEIHVFKGGPKESIDKGTINVDMGYITKDNVLFTLNMGIHQNEPTPEQYSVSGSTFGDPRSGSYFQNDIYTVGVGTKVTQVKDFEIFIFGQVGMLSKKFYPIYRDPMGILGGSDDRYITLTGEMENSMIMGGGLLVTYEQKYVNLSATDKSVNLCVGIMF